MHGTLTCPDRAPYWLLRGDREQLQCPATGSPQGLSGGAVQMPKWKLRSSRLADRQHSSTLFKSSGGRPREVTEVHAALCYGLQGAPHLWPVRKSEAAQTKNEV